jgi:hypothetical protein
MRILPVRSTFLFAMLLALPSLLAFVQVDSDLVDIRQYGARAVNAWWQYGTTVTGTAGSNRLTVASPSIFRNADGIVIYGAGRAPVVSSAPIKPTVMPGISETETVPDAPMVPLSKGTESYSYSIVARDLYGGLSAASPIATISNGPGKLGQHTIPIARLNLIGRVITATTAIPHGLADRRIGSHYEGPLVHLKDSTNSQTFSGWWDLSSIPSPTTVTITGTSRDSITPINATGGSLVYFTGNLITWKPIPNAWEYVVCGKRPGDPKPHVLGVTMPSRPGGGYTVATFTDWGAPLTGVNLKLPSYINDSVCTQAQPSNDYFSSTVISGGGTTALTLKDKLVHGVNGTTAFVDATPGILAAARAAQQNGQTLYIPSAGRGQNFYQINSTLDLPRSLDVLQFGQIRLGETMIVNSSTNWTGRGSAAPPVFAWKSSPSIAVAEANPGVYVNGGADDFDSSTLIAAAGNDNQAVLMVVDNAWGATFRYLNLSTDPGGAEDLTGVALVVRASTNTKFEYPDLSGGPGYVIDQTWTPLVYMPESQDGSGSTGVWTIKDGMFNRRGILFRARGGGGLNCEMDRAYIQGSIRPFLALENTWGNVGAQVSLKRLAMDTSSQAFLALWGTGGSIAAQVDIEGTNNGGMGVEANGGRATILTGIRVSDLTSRELGSALGQ